MTKLAGFEFTKYIKYNNSGEIIALRALNLRQGELDLTDIKRIDKSVSELLPRSKLYSGDILLTYTGNGYGDCALISENDRYHLAPNICKITPDIQKIDPYFLYSYIRSKAFYQQMSNHMVGSSQPTIPMRAIRELKVPFPSLEKQKKIKVILSTLDGKIRINHAINDNLQQQAAALFSSLYDRTNTEVRFTDLIQILGGGTPKTGENTYWNGNIAFFTPKDVGTPYTLITEKTITEEGLSHCNSRLYPVNTVFVTARGTVGKVGMSGVPMAMNQSCYALVGKETHQLLVYFYTLKAVDRLKHKASGAVFDAITTRDFESEQIMKLSDDDAKAFLCIAEPMFQKVLNNCIENLRLSTLRDSLLPKLMSGEVDVSAVQL